MRYFIYCRKSSEAEDRQILSIDSQLTTLRRSFGNLPEIEVVAVYEEAFSAKAPGRARFNEMLGKIERGDAEGIIAWAPDRLARNSIDGGRVVYLLDRGVIRDLKFATYTFENNSQGKFMLQIMFGQSKYYSDALSENVKRGNRTKVENGWRPNQAPLGYTNDSVTKTIVKDPIHFPLIRQMYELMLTGAYSPRTITLIARDDWGFRTPLKKRTGGRPLALSSVYKILTNQFYAGRIEWNGQVYPGKHEPIVSSAEFLRVRQLLSRPGRSRPQKRIFAFTGMIRCPCGLQVTAENKINRQGHRYVYYHCSRSRLERFCREAAIEIRSLERQIGEFLHSISIEQSIQDWVLEEVSHQSEAAAGERAVQATSLRKTASALQEQLAELTGLRIRKLIDDAEFLERRANVEKEQDKLRARLASLDIQAKTLLEPARTLISFSCRAVDWFLAGDDHAKRQIFRIVCSNPILRSKKLNIEATKPFFSAVEIARCPHQLGVVEDVRTCEAHRKRWLKRFLRDVGDVMATEKGQDMLNDITELIKQFEPELLLPLKKKRPRRSRAGASLGLYRARPDAPPFLGLPPS